LKFCKELHSRLIRPRFQVFKHLRPVRDEALGTGTASAGLFDAAVFKWPDNDAPSTRILTPQLHALRQTINVLGMKPSWKLDAQLLKQLRGRCSENPRGGDTPMARPSSARGI
jgi:hypothetical protein